MNDVFLLLGSNIGNRHRYIEDAIAHIDRQIGRVIVRSKLYETAAWGKEDQDNFLNQAIRVYTSHDPHRLLRTIHSIERQMDRSRDEKWGPRTIDIDILLINDEVILEEGICIPHRQLHKRRFALAPLNEITPTKIHPILNVTISQLLEKCTDNLKVTPIERQHV